MGLYSHYDGAHNHLVNGALHMIAILAGFSSVIVVWWHGSLRSLVGSAAIFVFAPQANRSVREFR
jgi:hypothetical protein